MDEKEWLASVGKKIKVLRAENDIQQNELAQKLNVVSSTVAHYERGRRTLPAYMVYRMSEIFNVSADYLLGLSEVKEPVWKKDELQNPDIRMIARMVTERDDAERLRKVAEAMYPKKFNR